MQSLHDPEVYPDPEDFIPERWMPGGANADGGDSKNWLVFGAGAHKCIGASRCPRGRGRVRLTGVGRRVDD